jgi:RHS repeat-associated protein
VGGAHLDLRKYWPFGELASSLDPYSTERLGLGQMERDLEANRYYDHARSLDVTVARFLSVDSVGGDPFAPQSLNRYTYVLSNPLKYQDPNGRFPWLAAGVLGAGVLIEGGFRVADYKVHHPDATGGELWTEFAIGGAAGAVETAVGMGLTRMPGVKNPYLIGAAVATTGAITTQAMEMAFKQRAPGDWDASDIFVKTALGLFMGKLAELRYPTEFGAAVPHYWKSRAFREIGQFRGRGRNVTRRLDNRSFESLLMTTAFRFAEGSELVHGLDVLIDYFDPDVDTSIGIPEGRVDETWTWRPIDDDTSEQPLPDVQWD